MTKAGKMQNLVQEMRKINFDIMVESEIRWLNSGEVKVKDHKIFSCETSNGVN